MPTRLSIIVPVYNVEQYLRQCLESILSQPLPKGDYEVIVVDDGSPDDSIPSIQDLAERYPETIRIVRQKNGGLSVARNTGLDHAEGEYIMFVDSDDCLAPQTLHLLIDNAEQAKVDMLRAGYIKIEDANVAAYLEQSPAPSSFEAPDVVTGQEALARHNTRECYVWMNLFRRAFIEEHHLRFEPKIFFEDMAFTMECYLRAGSFVELPLTFYIYRQRQGSILQSMKPDKLTSLNSALRLMDDMKSRIPMTAEARRRLNDTIFDSMSIGLWYLSHYHSLYPHRRQVLRDLKTKLPRLWFAGNARQMLVSLCLHLCAERYIELKYRTASVKY